MKLKSKKQLGMQSQPHNDTQMNEIINNNTSIKHLQNAIPNININAANK